MAKHYNSANCKATTLDLASASPETRNSYFETAFGSDIETWTPELTQEFLDSLN